MLWGGIFLSPSPICNDQQNLGLFEHVGFLQHSHIARVNSRAYTNICQTLPIFIYWVVHAKGRVGALAPPEPYLAWRGGGGGRGWRGWSILSKNKELIVPLATLESDGDAPVAPSGHSTSGGVTKENILYQHPCVTEQAQFLSYHERNTLLPPKRPFVNNQNLVCHHPKKSFVTQTTRLSHHNKSFVTTQRKPFAAKTNKALSHTRKPFVIPRETVCHDNKKSFVTQKNKAISDP